MQRMSAMVLGIVLVAGQMGFGLTTAWTEDFSSNPVPTWTKTGGQINWRAGSGDLGLENYYDSSSSFSRPAGVTLNQNQDFKFTMDYQTGYAWYCTAIKGGLTNSGANGQVVFQAAPNWPNYDSKADLIVQIQDSEGTWYSSGSLSVDAYTNCAMTMNYDAASRYLSLNLVNKADSNDLGTVGVTLPAVKSFSVDQFKFYNAGGNGDYWCYADNINFMVPEPVTMVILTLGGLMGLWRRS